ncbi:MAG: hypothetical protein WBH90_15745 [Aggregatilineales bacterium]|nr:hypothetical protein [Chloroflexota bacterium]HOA24406.1 hypothetical protein [Aggregatilineales bacterium]HPV07071.1 hypothetical protein [Aggregatilineales bacterium]HQE17031.1 hypothetical protein [Aggregatilineales bacterium]
MVKRVRTVLALVVLAGALVGCGGQAPAGQDEDAEVIVESVDALIMESFPVQVNAVVTGTLFDGCVEIENAIVERDGSTFRIDFETERLIDALCQPGRVPFEQVVPLDVLGLEAGTYTVEAGGASTTFTLDVDNTPLGEE